MKKTLLLVLFLLLNFLSKSQSTAPLISRIDYQCNSSMIPNRAAGTIKYEYDGNGKLIGINTFNKENLNDVHQIKFGYKTNQLSVIENSWSQPIKTDEKGRITEINYKSNSDKQLFPQKLSLNYINGYLSRITAFEWNKVSLIYQFTYESGNLIKIAPTFKAEDVWYPHTYTIKYSNQTAPANFNFGLGLFLAIQYGKIEQFPIYVANNYILGYQSKNLIEQITDNPFGKDEGIHSYQLKYDYDNKGRVSKLILTHENSEITDEDISTFTISYKN